MKLERKKERTVIDSPRRINFSQICINNSSVEIYPINNNKNRFLSFSFYVLKVYIQSVSCLF